MKAKKKPLTVLDLDALKLTTSDIEPRTARTSVELPPARQAGQRLTGTVDEQVQKLADILLAATHVGMSKHA